MGAGDKGFWDFRRARPLLEFVPLSTTSLRFMARGWLVASLLGQIKFETKMIFGHPYLAPELEMPGSTTRAGFIQPALGRLPSAHRDVFAAVLETYPLAEVLYATGQPNELKAYGRLLELGSGPALNTWITTGVTDAGNAPMGVDADARAEYVLKVLGEAKERLGEYETEFVPEADHWELPPRGMEIRGLMNEALNEMIESAQASQATATESGEGIVYV